MDDPADDGSKVLQLEIDRLSAELGVRSMPVGMRTNDGLNIVVADAGSPLRLLRARPAWR
ncbi:MULTISPECIES: hypothetical protein [Mycolicibacter]|uniref:hypothetical protein n=1 Tax=Mycolicibacter TaxID=1073531 RepID=UPI000A663EE0